MQHSLVRWKVAFLLYYQFKYFFLSFFLVWICFALLWVLNFFAGYVPFIFDYILATLAMAFGIALFVLYFAWKILLWLALITPLVWLAWPAFTSIPLLYSYEYLHALSEAEEPHRNKKVDLRIGLIPMVFLATVVGSGLAYDLGAADGFDKISNDAQIRWERAKATAD